jgi:uncharacterized protein with HEPN domain
MRRDPRAYLWDAQSALDAITEFTAGKDLQVYLADAMLRAAVERQFEIIGEALQQLSKVAPEISSQIPGLRQIVAFRNLLIHGYATVNHETVWRTLYEDLPLLRPVLARLLAERGVGS